LLATEDRLLRAQAEHMLASIVNARLLAGS